MSILSTSNPIEILVKPQKIEKNDGKPNKIKISDVLEITLTVVWLARILFSK
jgi:hypothetical protein